MCVKLIGKLIILCVELPFKTLPKTNNIPLLNITNVTKKIDILYEMCYN